MKQRYCTICGSPIPKGKQESGKWVSADGKQRIPLYYCSSECISQHIFLPTAIKQGFKPRVLLVNEGALPQE